MGRGKTKMVCLLDPRGDQRVVTHFLRPSDRVQTARGSMTVSEWLESERRRFERNGVACEVVQSKTGRLALRRLTPSA